MRPAVSSLLPLELKLKRKPVGLRRARNLRILCIDFSGFTLVFACSSSLSMVTTRKLPAHGLSLRRCHCQLLSFQFRSMQREDLNHKGSGQPGAVEAGFIIEEGLVDSLLYLTMNVNFILGEFLA